MNPFVVAFDLDGTLFTSEAILGLSYETCVRAANLRWNSAYRIPLTDEILTHVGQPVRKIFLALYPEMPEDFREELANDVLSDLSRRIRAREGSLYAGVTETLEKLGEHSPLLLISNCRRGYLEAVVDTYDLAKYFEGIACNEDAPELGKPGLLKKLLDGRPGVMIGDRASDGEAARHAGVPWIGCCYGYSENELIGADTVIRSIPEVIEAMKPLIKKI